MKYEQIKILLASARSYALMAYALDRSDRDKSKAYLACANERLSFVRSLTRMFKLVA